jgi:hypothetical protein
VLALDETENIMVAVYEHEIARHLRNYDSGMSFCLSNSAIKLVEIDKSVQKVGDGASNNVVSALRAQGYNVFSLTECVYDSTSGLHVRPRSGSGLSFLIHLGPIIWDGTKAVVEVGYWAGPTVCEERTLKVEHQSGRYTIVNDEARIIC